MSTPREKWWKLPQPNEQITADLKVLFTQQATRQEENLTNLRLYGNRYITGMSGNAYEQMDPLQTERLTLNVIQSCIDAATSKISTNDTRVQFLTEGGKWKQQQKAMNLTRFLDGQFYLNNTYQESEESFSDALIFDLGAVKHFIDDRDMDHIKVCSERTLPTELWVDQIDAKYGKPRSLYHVKEVGKETLAANPNYKGKAAKISQATLIEPGFTAINSDVTLADPCSVMEAWHLPSYPGGPNGRHVICVSSCVLLEEPWEWEYFPFSFFRWNKRKFGFYGQGLAEQLRSIQVSINKILRQVERHMDRASSFVLAERGAKIVKSQLVNTPWTLLEYTGQAPVFATVQAISPEYFSQLDRLYSRAFEIAGISQLFAGSKVPGNLKSGRAISEAKDTESERFMKTGKDWGRFQLDIGKKQIMLAKQVDEMLRDAGEEDGYTVMARNEDDTLDRLKWDDVSLEDDAYIMQPMASSYLPKTPAFRIQAALDLVERYPQLEKFMPKLLEGIPDLKGAVKQLDAPRNYLDKITDRMLYEDAETEEELDALYVPPDSFTDTLLALEISRNKFCLAQLEGAPPERLDLLSRFMTACQKLMEAPPGSEEEMQSQAMQQPMPGGMPPGMPMGAPSIGDVNINPNINLPSIMPGGGF